MWSGVKFCVVLVGFTKINTELFLLRHITTLTSIQARIIFFKDISCSLYVELVGTVVVLRQFICQLTNFRYRKTKFSLNYCEDMKTSSSSPVRERTGGLVAGLV